MWQNAKKNDKHPSVVICFVSLKDLKEGETIVCSPLCKLTFHYNVSPCVLWSLRQGFYTGLEGINQISTALCSLLSDTETQSRISKIELSFLTYNKAFSKKLCRYTWCKSEGGLKEVNKSKWHHLKLCKGHKLSLHVHHRDYIKLFQLKPLQLLLSASDEVWS